jgi:alkanesulfonate monooxygenase SsuD/methylene tetrahydromethanopterin reductase-like flavin-dependent oxidoreductase (luciferase family)
MTFKLGYLLPTRENVMRGDHTTTGLLEAAMQAQTLGFDSVWIGDSLLARPRHDPLTLLAAVAARVPKITLGTAVLLPALRNPVVLAQQLATIDQISEGRLVVGAGIAADTPQVRAEFLAAGVPFEGRVGRLLEAFELCRALWRGETVQWDGRWKVQDGVLAPLPYSENGPPIWLASGVEQGIQRAAKYFDGWLPIGPNQTVFAQNKRVYDAALEANGRKQSDGTTAIYLTIAVAPTVEEGGERIDAYLQEYYMAPANALRSFQACFGGPLENVLAFIRSYVDAGAEHIVLRLVGDHTKILQDLATHRAKI